MSKGVRKVFPKGSVAKHVLMTAIAFSGDSLANRFGRIRRAMVRIATLLKGLFLEEFYIVCRCLVCVA